MQARIHNPSIKSGLRPGSLVHVGQVHDSKTQIHLFDYGQEHFEHCQLESLETISQYRDAPSTTWVVVEGLADVGIIEKIGEMFDIHPLVLEDILNTHQRPKFEEYDNYLYLVAKSIHSENIQFAAEYEQISLLVFPGCILTFKERSDDLLQPVADRLATGKGRLRIRRADYLAYAILDAIVDQYFVLIDQLDETVDKLEEKLIAHEPTRELLTAIQTLKREIIGIRRQVSPMREMFAAISHCESDLIDDSTQIYFRDVSDHAIRVVESVELYRDLLTGLLDIYLSSLSNKMNDVMKVLTIFSSIFIPLTFLTGIYGMNFEYMPELEWKWSYPLLWVAFIAIPLLLLRFFRKKGWI